MWLQTRLAAVAAFCSRFAVAVVLFAILFAFGCTLLVSHRLKIDTDTDNLFSAHLPWRQAQIAMNHDFPQYNDLLVGVLEGAAPEEREAAAAAIAAAVATDHANFKTVARPDALPFYRSEGLLFLPLDQLNGLLNTLVTAQPFLGQLAADPSMRGLLTAIGLIAQGAEQGQVNIKPYDPAMTGFHAALQAAADGKPVPLSWQSLLGGGLSEKAGPYRFVLVRPVQDHGELQPGAKATDALRAIAARVPEIASGRVQFHITGQIALADQQFASLTQGVVTDTVVTLVLIILWLVLAVRRIRYIVAILATLALGLVTTTGFAALAIGTLNLISVAFAVLFVGLAIDFAIQISVRYREARAVTPDAPSALTLTMQRAGNSVFLASLATAAGFLAFVPTDFAGVAELGLIAGVGMIIAFICSVTFLPAMITLLRLPAEKHEVGFTFLAPVDLALWRFRRPLLGLGLLLVIFGAVLLPRLGFDSDPLDTQDRHSEAMQTLRKLEDNPLTNPYTIDLMAPSAEAGAVLAKKLEALPSVDSVISAASFVPDDQAAKLEAIADTAQILAPTLNPGPAAPVTPGDIRIAARTAFAEIDKARPNLAAGSPLLAIGDDLKRLADQPDAALMTANAALIRFLPEELETLNLGLSAQPVTFASLPAALKRDWLLPDGQARLQVIPRAEAHNSNGLRTFVAQVTAVAPNASGSAVTIIRSAQTIVGAFREAAILALIAIAAILTLMLRRINEVLLILAPLLLSTLMTVTVLVLVPQPLNFANVIALPLLQGVGVSFNLYFVMNWRRGERNFLSSATARAVLFSALTTGTAFGSLAFSHHPGTASMGLLLLISLGCTLLATFVFEPALLYAVPVPGQRGAPAPGTPAPPAPTPFDGPPPPAGE